MGAYTVDILAVGFFVLEWTVYAVTLEYGAYGGDSLSSRMHTYREVWIRRMLDREARMVDMQIMASLQNGTAFFASTSLFAWAPCRSICAPPPHCGRSNASG
jgi:uncharacterized membrane protein